MISFGTDGVRAPFSPHNTDTMECITPETAFRVGLAAARILDLPRWVVVQDTRKFNPQLNDALKLGLYTGGAKVADAGVLPTPAAAYLAGELSEEDAVPHGAISLSASHNPAEIAGIKVFGARGYKLDDLESKKIAYAANELKIPSMLHTDANRIQNLHKMQTLKEMYLGVLDRTIDPELSGFLEGKFIVVDAANGAAHWSAPTMLELLGARVLSINTALDGEINKNCGATDTKAMIQEVYETGASYGMALDGDADRLIAFSRGRTGERVLDGDDAIAIAVAGLDAAGKLSKRGVVVTDYSSVGFKREMDRQGVAVHVVANGDRYVSDKLKEGWPVGGEKSGHTLYPEVAREHDMTLSGDGTLAALQQLQVAAHLGKPLHEISSWPLLGYERADIHVPAGIDSGTLLKRTDVDQAIKSLQTELGDDGLILVRGSGTEPVVRVLVKAANPEQSAALFSEIKTTVEKAVES